MTFIFDFVTCTTISEFSTFLKSSKSRGTISSTVNSFLPYLRLTVKGFQFLRLSTKFLAVLRLSVTPIETLVTGLLRRLQVNIQVFKIIK